MRKRQFTQNPFFFPFCFLKKYALFHPHFYKSISALSRLLHTVQIKILLKNFLRKRQERYFKIGLYPFAKTFFRKTFVQYVSG